MTTLAARPLTPSNLDPIEIINAPAGNHPSLLTATAYLKLGLRPIPLCDPLHRHASERHVQGGRRPDGSYAEPCSSPGKAPLERNYPRFAELPPSPAGLVRMFKHHRGNIGGVVAKGHVVLDIDKRSGGLESLERLTGEHGVLPWTPTVATGGGGIHYYFRLPAGIDVKDGGSLERLGYRGVEWKGPGAQVVLPGSVHASHIPYRWEAYAGLGEVAIEPIPSWLLDLILKAQGPAKRSKTEGRPSPTDKVQSKDVQAYFAGLFATVGTDLLDGDRYYPCPFHEETRPSLHIDSRRCVWHCFGTSCIGHQGGGVVELEAMLGPDRVRQAGRRPHIQRARSDESASQLRPLVYPNSDAPREDAQEDLKDEACRRFPLPKDIKPEVVVRIYAYVANPSRVMRQTQISNTWDNEANRAVKRRMHWAHLLPRLMAAAETDGIFEVVIPASDWSDRKRQALAAQVRRLGGQYAAFDNRTAAGVVRWLTDVPVAGSAKVADVREALSEALRDCDMPGESTKARVHLIWLSKAWSMGGHQSKGLMKLVATRGKGGPLDDEAEEAEARRLGLETWQGHEHKLEEWGPPRFYGLREEVATTLTKKQALDQVLSALMALGYRVLPKADERVIGQTEGAGHDR